MRYIKTLTEQQFDELSDKINLDRGYPCTLDNGFVVETYLNKSRSYHPKYGYFVNKDAVTSEYINDFTTLPNDFFDLEYTFDFILGEDRVNKVKLKSEISYLKREPRGLLNNMVDVYFIHNNQTYGVRFTDWNVFRVLSDEQCEEKLREYIDLHSSIEHPAKALA